MRGRSLHVGLIVLASLGLWGIVRQQPERVHRAPVHRTTVSEESGTIAPPEDAAERHVPPPRSIQTVPTADGMTLDFASARIHFGTAEVRCGTRLLSVGTPEEWEAAGASYSREVGFVTERYVLGSERAEQLFIVSKKPVEGGLTVRTRIATDLVGPVMLVSPGEAGWHDEELAEGGLQFRDEATGRTLVYYGAKAIDAEGRETVLDPRWENGEIVLEVPEIYVAGASFPLTIDPWIQVGSSASGNGIGVGGEPDVRLDGGGKPVVAWNASGQVRVRRWTGTSWMDLGSPGEGATGRPSLAISGTGAIFVAWSQFAYDPQYGYTNQIYLKRWNGSAWSELGGSASGGGVSRAGFASCFNPTVCFDAGNQPWVCWSESLLFPNPTRVVVKQWTGSWSVRKAFPNLNAKCSLTMAANPGSGVTVGYIEPSGSIRLHRWTRLANPNTWIIWSPFVPNGSQPAVNLSLTVDASRMPIVAWQSENPQANYANIFVRRRSQGTWTSLGDGVLLPPNPFGPPEHPDRHRLALDSSDNPVIVWDDGNEVLLRRWNGSAWVGSDGFQVDSISLTPARSTYPSIAGGPGNRLVIAWTEAAKIYLRSYSAFLGSRWENVSGPNSVGWRLVGVAHDSDSPLQTGAFVNAYTRKPDQILSPFYELTPSGYKVATSLERGKGYYVKTAPGAMMQDGGEPPTAPQISFSRSAGWHLMANPYAENLPWTYVHGTNAIGGPWVLGADGAWRSPSPGSSLRKFEGILIRFGAGGSQVTFTAP